MIMTPSSNIPGSCTSEKLTIFALYAVIFLLVVYIAWSWNKNRTRPKVIQEGPNDLINDQNQITTGRPVFGNAPSAAPTTFAGNF